MIVDTQDPRDVEISSQSISQSSIRSKNRIKTVVLDIMHQMRGGDGRDRDLDLDDTRSRLSRESTPSNDSEFRANDRRVQIPQWLLLFLILQGAGIIWWAATIQSDLKYLQLENAKLWTTLESTEKEVNDQSKEFENKIRNTVKDELANQLLNRGIIRIPTNP